LIIYKDAVAILPDKRLGIAAKGMSQYSASFGLIFFATVVPDGVKIMGSIQLILREKAVEILDFGT
jgi:hypothetical protein